MLKEDFLNSIKTLEEIDTEAFLTAMGLPAEVSIKMNRRKCTEAAVTGFDGLEPVKWCKNGYYLPERPKFTLNPLLHAGVFYVQDASSMIYETVTGSLISRGLLPERPMVLDMCAAPGGKTTSIINAVPDGSTVVANEVMPKRVQILAENLQKWGYPEIMVTNMQAKGFRCVSASFDLVAVDAPCSGEGMMRKDEDACSQWSPRLVAQCAALQQEILREAVDALRPGGVLIYSTCTFNTTENETNVEWLVKELGLTPVDPGVDPAWGIGSQIGSQIPALRFMPHLTRGEGLFLAVLQKPGEAVPVPHHKTLASLQKNGKVILNGIPQTASKGKIEVPASQWALSTSFPADRYPACELDKETAIRYLSHEAISLDANAPRGFVVVTYKGFPLGFVKNIGNRANNLFPAQWRIRTQYK
ncbi:MAG: hypothetical protein HDR84_08350 [Bacteroides sp.]|nr:hypothetical protein [Bacteroides sp.]